MNTANQIAFSYRPRLGVARTAALAIALVVVAIAIGAFDLSNASNSRWHGLTIVPAVRRPIVLLFCALLIYLALRTLLVAMRSAGGDRSVVLTEKRITAPMGPTSAAKVSIAWTEISTSRIVEKGNANCLEISHKRGKLRIPSALIESDLAFKQLAEIVDERRASARQAVRPRNDSASQSASASADARAESTRANPARDALMRAIEEKRKTDPLIGAKLGGKEVFQRLLNVMKDDRGVQVESLLVALGALAGYSCQANLRAQALSRGMAETAAFQIVGTADGKSYYYGDPLNQSLAESKYSVWSLAAGAAQHNGCTELPDLNEIFQHVTETVGTVKFGRPRYPEGRNAGDLPINYLKALWPALLPLAKEFCKDPQEWPILFGSAIQEALDAGKQAISQDLALSIVMESAVSMSKVDLAAA